MGKKKKKKKDERKESESALKVVSTPLVGTIYLFFKITKPENQN